MTFALVIDATVQSVGRLPASARRLDTGDWVMGLADAPAELREATGWLPVTDTARPDDTATTTFDRTVELVADVPTVVWTERPKTQAELDGETQAATDATIRTQAIDHLTDLRAIATSTGAFSNTQRDVAIRHLARGQIRLIRLTLGLLDGTD